jgi:hypothetical protein
MYFPFYHRISIVYNVPPKLLFLAIGSTVTVLSWVSYKTFNYDWSQDGGEDPEDLEMKLWSEQLVFPPQSSKKLTKQSKEHHKENKQ